MIDDIFSVPIYRTKFTDVDHLRELCLSQAFAELDGKTREQEVYFGGDIASEPNTTDSNRLVLTIDYNRTGT